MSHYTQTRFVEYFSKCACSRIAGASVLEIGSHDVNGSVRSFFSSAREYVGIDVAPGAGVDVVASGHEFGESNSYDVVLSCECFEHNPYWLETFVNMVRVCRDGGFVVFTCATTGRPEHGTTRSDRASNPGGEALNWTYYRNLTQSDFTNRLRLSQLFYSYRFFEVNWSQDLLFIGVKKPWSSVNHFDADANGAQDIIAIMEREVSEISRSAPARPRRFPLLGWMNSTLMTVAAMTLDDRTYQNFRFFWGDMVKKLVGVFSRK